MSLSESADGRFQKLEEASRSIKLMNCERTCQFHKSSKNSDQRGVSHASFVNQGIFKSSALNGACQFTSKEFSATDGTKTL